MSYNTTMRYTGMSGIDTASMVTQLMEAESMKKNSVYRQRQILQYTQDAYRGVSSNVRAFQSKFLSFSTTGMFNMRSSATFGKNTTTLTGKDGLDIPSFKGKVTASSSVPSGNYDFNVKSVASNEVRTGQTVNSNLKLNATLGGSTLDSEDSFDVTYNGVTRRINAGDYINESGTGNTDQEILQRAFDDNFGANKVTVTNDGISVGAGNTLAIEEGPIKDKAVDFLKTLPNEGVITDADRFYTNLKIPEEMTSDINHKFNVTVAGEEKEIIIDLRVEDYEGGKISREDYLNTLNDALGTDGTALVDEQGRVYFDGATTTNVESFGGEDLKAANIETFTVNVGGEETAIEIVTIDEMTNSQYISEVNASLRDKGITAITASSYTEGEEEGLRFTVTQATNESYTVGVGGVNQNLESTSSIQKLGIETGGSTAISVDDTLENALGIVIPDETGGSVTINGVEISYTKDTTLKEFMSAVNGSSADVNLSFSGTTGSFTLSGNSTGAINAIKIGGDSNGVFEAMNVSDSQTASYLNHKKAEDTVVNYNGIDITRETSTVEIDGITLELNSNSVGEDFKVFVEKDTSNTLEAITKFVEDYNLMLEEVQNEYKTPRPRSDSRTNYEPLTEEERASMSETQQEQWDEKAKAGMLYNDPLLRRFASDMRSITYSKVELPDGSKISLQDLGITTGDYSEGGKLVIDKEKLEAGIEKYGDDIAVLFTKSDTGIAEKMNKSIDNAFSTSGYITEKAGRENSVTVNENALSRAITRKDDELHDLTRYLMDKENYYYRIFTAMEQSVMKANNQMSYLATM